MLQDLKLCWLIPCVPVRHLLQVGSCVDELIWNGVTSLENTSFPFTCGTGRSCFERSWGGRDVPLSPLLYDYWGGRLCQPPGCRLLWARSLSTSSKAFLSPVDKYWSRHGQARLQPNAQGTCCRQRCSRFQALLQKLSGNVVLLLCLEKESGQAQITAKQRWQSVWEVRHYPDTSCRAAAWERRLSGRGGPGKERMNANVERGFWNRAYDLPTCE